MYLYIMIYTHLTQYLKWLKACHGPLYVLQRIFLWDNASSVLAKPPVGASRVVLQYSHASCDEQPCGSFAPGVV
jgi:hypothetical protein